MTAVALVALTTMCLGNSVSTAFLVLIILLAFPVVLTPRGTRLRASAWVASLYVFVPWLASYSLWVGGWWCLGHAPRPSLDDPALLFSRLRTLWAMFLISLLGLPVSILASLSLTAVSAQLATEKHSGPAKDMAPLIGMVIAWLAVIVLLAFDPLGVLDWLMD